MNQRIACGVRVALWLAVLVVVAGAMGRAQAVTSEEVKGELLQPGVEYSTGPLWVWNEWMTQELVRSTLQDLAGQGVRRVFVHPRPGLMTPYLSERWFTMWEAALEEGERLGMEVWIYDENSYPSGFGGGHVPDEMPQSRGKGLSLREEPNQPAWSERMVAVYRMEKGGFENVTEAVRRGEDAGEGPFMVGRLELAGTAAWYGGKTYVNLLDPGVTEKFLEVTLEPYRQRFGEKFGGRIPGIFSDEPHVRPARHLPWGSDLAQQFEKRWRYSLLEHLPSLVREVGDWRRVRHNYYELVLELFAQRWGRTYYEYCDKVGLEFTGHYWEHEWPSCVTVPDNMAMYAWEHRPGIDTLMNQYAEHTRAQFGNVRAAKEVASVGNQLGRRTLSEAFGASGWDFRFEDMKRVGDWLVVLGVNSLTEHLSYATIRGARKQDHPLSFSYHEPWWPAYHVVEEYLSRLCAVMSQGQEVNRVLVLEPTTTVWMFQMSAQSEEKREAVGLEFFSLVMELSRAQVEYDLGCEYILERWGSVEGPELRVGEREYETVVLAPGMENVNTATAKLLEAFVAGGGEVLCCGAAPAYVDGTTGGRMAALESAGNWRRMEAAEVVTELAGRPADGFRVERADQDAGILFHQRRQLADGDVVLLVNTSLEAPSRGAVRSAANGAEQWDAQTGQVEAYAFERTGAGIEAKFELAPAGSLLLFLSDEASEPGQKENAAVRAARAVGQMQVQRKAENVVVLDYVDVSVGGESRENVYTYEAARFVFNKHGLERNPWSHATQFGDEMVSRTFPADSGFEATYRFVVNEQTPERISVVIERPDLYEITCNGKRIEARDGQWWLDRVFGRMDVADVVRVGVNEVKIQAKPFTVYHELEPAYVVGDFGVEAAESGFAIVPAGRLTTGAWKEQGMPLYGGAVAYRRTFEVETSQGDWYVELGDWYGSVAEVRVNGERAGYVWHRPWRCDATGRVKEGVNVVEVVVTGTLKNTLGPHHGEVGRGTAWPSMFQKGPNPGPPAGDAYDTLEYGLFGDFRLVGQSRETL